MRNGDTVVALLRSVADRIDPLPELPPRDVCRRLRTRAGLSQQVVATTCGVALNAVLRFENGHVERPLVLAASRRYRALLAWLMRLEQEDAELAVDEVAA